MFCDLPFGVQVEGREEVGELLGMEGKVDLVIPRGGNALVHSVMDQTQGRIPVLGHTEGVCHVYVDKHADMGKATNVGESQAVQWGMVVLCHHMFPDPAQLSVAIGTENRERAWYLLSRE